MIAYKLLNMIAIEPCYIQYDVEWGKGGVGQERAEERRRDRLPCTSIPITRWKVMDCK